MAEEVTASLYPYRPQFTVYLRTVDRSRMPAAMMSNMQYYGKDPVVGAAIQACLLECEQQPVGAVSKAGYQGPCSSSSIRDADRSDGDLLA